MKRMILIVENDPDIAECLQYNLRLEQLSTQIARSAEEGLSAFLNKDQTPAIVLLDSHMLELDGPQVCRRLREETRAENIPLILLASFSTDSLRAANFQIDADYYISKPYSMRDVTAMVESALHHPRKSQFDSR
jgi:DNA-binding response OmpR family regulator